MNQQRLTDFFPVAQASNPEVHGGKKKNYAFVNGNKPVFIKSIAVKRKRAQISRPKKRLDPKDEPSSQNNGNCGESLTKRARKSVNLLKNNAQAREVLRKKMKATCGDDRKTNMKEFLKVIEQQKQNEAHSEGIEQPGCVPTCDEELSLQKDGNVEFTEPDSVCSESRISETIKSLEKETVFNGNSKSKLADVETETTSYCQLNRSELLSVDPEKQEVVETSSSLKKESVNANESILKRAKKTIEMWKIDVHAHEILRQKMETTCGDREPKVKEFLKVIQKQKSCSADDVKAIENRISSHSYGEEIQLKETETSQINKEENTQSSEFEIAKFDSQTKDIAECREKTLNVEHFEWKSADCEMKTTIQYPLPYKYDFLSMLFDQHERVVSILLMQGKRIRLSEVAINVQKNLKKEYNIHHFAQILYVYPTSYCVRVEESWAAIGGLSKSAADFEYVIEPNLVDDIAGYTKMSDKIENSCEISIEKSDNSTTNGALGECSKGFISSPSKHRGYNSLLSPIKVSSPRKFLSNACGSLTGSFSTVKTNGSPTKFGPKLEARRIYIRSCIFKHRLQMIVKAQHAAFLKKKGLTLTAEQLNNIKKLHSDFVVNDIDDIPEADLPKLPKGDKGLPKIMRDYVKNVDDSINTLPDKIQRVIKELRSPEKRLALAAGSSISLSPLGYAEDAKKEPKKMSIIERVRAKEQARKLQAMLRNPELEMRLFRLNKLEMSLLRNICSFFIFKKVTSMKLLDLIERMAFSMNCPFGEISGSVDLLCEIATEFFEITLCNGEKYIQIKENDYKKILNVIQTEKSRCKDL